MDMVVAKILKIKEREEIICQAWVPLLPPLDVICRHVQILKFSNSNRPQIPNNLPLDIESNIMVGQKFSLNTE